MLFMSLPHYWTHGGVSRSWEVSLGLGGGLGKEYGPIIKDWGHDIAEIGQTHSLASLF